MLLYLVKDFPLQVRRLSGGEDSDNWTWTAWKTTFDIDLSTDNHDNGAIPIEYQQAYCRKMRDILASDGTPMALTAILTWDHRTSYLYHKEMNVRLVGRILEKLSATWEQSISIITEVYFRNVELMPTRGEVYRRSLHPSLRPRTRLVLPHIEHTFDCMVKTKEMLIQPALVVTGSIPNQRTTEAEPFVEDDDAKLNCSLGMGCVLKNYWCSVLSGHTDRHTINMELSVYFVVDNDYLTEDRDALKHLSSTNATILELGINSDVTIVTSNGAKVAAHKCFLSASSSVLAAMLSSDYFQECTSNNIKMVDASEQGVKALLQYIYTFKITEGRKYPMVAVELFQLAHKYDIPDLEKRMAEILEQRPDSWFDLESASSLFVFARNLERYNRLELKASRAITK